MDFLDIYNLLVFLTENVACSETLVRLLDDMFLLLSGKENIQKVKPSIHFDTYLISHNRFFKVVIYTTSCLNKPYPLHAVTNNFQTEGGVL